MNLYWIDWTIIIVFAISLITVAIWTKKYTHSVADFLAANRCAKRYLLCISSGMAGIGCISVIALFEMFYTTGFTATWWGLINSPLFLLLALSGWVIYRYRETRVLTLGQFIELRYSKKLRIFAGFLGWISGIINFGIFPSVAARFFIYFCGLPDNIPIIGISTYPFIMGIIIIISLLFVFWGGQITIMVTDFLQGTFTNIVFLLILGYFMLIFDWNTVIESLRSAPARQSMINPFATEQIKGFNPCFFLIGLFGTIYGYKAWQGSQGYNCSAKNAHEARMGGILGEWRGLIYSLLVMLLPIGVYTILHHPKFSVQAFEINNAINSIDNETVRLQMTVPLGLVKILPPGLIGLFCAMMLAATISTHDTYLHSWGSIFVQDVLLPFRSKPFSPRSHIWILRISIIFVAVFIFMFSLLFQQNQYIMMFFSITGAIYIGGAGAVIIGGLYWKRGSTLGAWLSLIIGCLISVTGMVVTQLWVHTIYPALEQIFPHFLYGLRWVCNWLSAHIPGLNWYVTPQECPLNSQWFYFFAMLSAIIAYVAGSVIDWFVLKKIPFNMERMLHRGKYAVLSPGHTIARPPLGLKAILPSSEFTIMDKVIYYGNMTWTLIWFAIFIVGVILHFTIGISSEGWIAFWGWKVVITIVFGVITTIWFLCGGVRDVINMFQDLSFAKQNIMDDGMVLNHHNIDEESLTDDADK